MKYIPSESQIEEIESVGFYVKYVLHKQKPSQGEVCKAALLLKEIGEKYEGYEDYLNKHLDLDDMKCVITKFMKIIMENIEEDDE